MKLRSALLCVLALCAAPVGLARPVWAQESAGQDIGGAMPDPTSEQPPKEVIALRKPHAITVRWQWLRLGTEGVWLHVYVIPTARARYSPQPPPPGHEKDPITRKDIFPGMALEPSPFYVEVYTETKNNKVTRLHRNAFTNESDVSSVAVQYLRPAQKTGAVVVLEGGFTHWRQWTLVGFPNGFRGKSSFVQTFLWGGEGDISVEQTFDKTDERGFMQVSEKSSEDGGKHEKRIVYRWNGQRFVDPDARYFVIGAATPTRAECEEYVRTNHREGEVEILQSDKFPNLKPGLFFVLVERTRTMKEAEEQVKLWKTRGLSTYAKRAF